jgi:hypothetical protein
VLVILPDGSVAFRFRSAASGDTPRTEDILAALKGQEWLTARGA